MSTTLTQEGLEPQASQILQQRKKIQIRVAKLEDVEVLGELWFYQRCYHEQWDGLYETTASGQQEWKEFIQSCLIEQNHCVLVAEDSCGMIVGYIHGSFYSWPFSPFEVYGSLNTIAVSPETQRQGIGKKLVKKLVSWFRKKDIQHVSVHVDFRNEGAIHLYQTVGFRSYQHRLMLELAV
ncbi:MAG: GNAT family N-acetyltransferase [Candidatus Hodarchaeota archaeon]